MGHCGGDVPPLLLEVTQNVITRDISFEGLFVRLSINQCNGHALAASGVMMILTYATIATLLTASVFGQSRKVHNGAGADVFNKQCIGCHGTDGRAQTETGKKVGAADLTSTAVQQETDSNLATIVQDGKGKMPSFEGKLSNNEINAVIAYVRQLANKE